MRSDSGQVQQWRRAASLFEAALEMEPPEQNAFLARACGEDRELLRTLHGLLRLDRTASSFLDRPLVSSPGLSPEDDPWVGRRLGPYLLLECIGQGGMSRVYLAERTMGEIRQEVALKIATGASELSDQQGRLQRECQILSRLQHPNIARFLDAGTGGQNLPFVVMEYIEGIAVDRYCDQRRLPIRQRLELFLEICDTIAFAHGMLVVHRDLKPSNILVTREGRPKLLDFGIAELLTPAALDPAAESAASERFLTLDYASPEQLAGGLVSTASDVYSLGALLYLLLCGNLPRDWAGRPSTEILERWRSEELEPPGETFAHPLADRSLAVHRGASARELRRQLSGDLEEICRKALRFEPAARYASVDRLMEDVRRHLQGRPIQARPASLGYRFGKLLGRHKLTALALGALLATLALAAILSTLYSLRLATERDAAQKARERADRATSFLVAALGQADPYQHSSPSAGRERSFQEVLDASVEKIDSGLPEQPLLQATLWQAFGMLYKNLGEIDTGISLLERAVRSRRRELGGRHPETGDALGQLGLLLSFRGRLAEAGPLVEEAVAIHRPSAEERPEHLARSLLASGVYRRAAGDLEGAEAHWREAVTLWRNLPDREVQAASTLAYLGDLLKLRGRFGEAEELLREGMAILERRLGDQHPETARIADDLGWVLVRQGRLEEAEPLLRQSLGTLRRQLGEEHPEVGTALQSVGSFLRHLGDLEGSQAMLRQSLALTRELYGEDHGHMVAALNSLALTLRARGQLEPAETHLRRAVEIGRELWQLRHPDAAASLFNLSLVLLDRGRYRDAEETLERFLEITREVQGPDHWSLGLGWTALARVANGEGRFAEGHRRALHALEILSAGLSPSHWRLAAARSVVGASLAGLGRWQEAEELLVPSHEALRAARGAGAGPTREAAESLARLYEARGRAADAERFRTLSAPPPR